MKEEGEMDSWNLYAFAKDLSTLMDLIRKYELPIESTSLATLDSQLQYQNEFKIIVDDVTFKVTKKISGTIPSEIDAISIILSHKCEIDYNKNIATNDPICDYGFQVHIKAYDKQKKQYTNWWHLDKNIASDKPKFTHPYYHFQAGGNEAEGVDPGGLILLSSPRLPHPPMDLFLGIHFIINNFFSSKDYPFVNEILLDEDYKGIILRSQKRMWDNYFGAFAPGNVHQDFTRENIFPLFMGA